MSLDKSLRKKSGMSRVRSVLKRGERIAKLTELEKFSAGASPFNLPKVRVTKLVAKKAKKVKTDDAADAKKDGKAAPAAGKAAPVGKAAPAAKAAAAPAAKPAGKK